MRTSIALAAALLMALPAQAQPVSGYFLSQSATSLVTSQPVAEADQAKWFGAPNDNWFGLGAQTVTFDLGGYRLVNGSGTDLVIYEADRDAVEFNRFTLWVSANGNDFHNISSSLTTNPVRITGDEAHSDANFRRGFDVDTAVTALAASEFRFIRLIGTMTAPQTAFGSANGFDLDGIGLVHFTAPPPPPPPVPGVPEPSAWAMLLAGFGLTGARLRRRRPISVAA
jgi:hypothetical protein